MLNRQKWWLSARAVAAVHGRPDMARLLLDAGADPSSVASYGPTPLMTAAQPGQLEVLRLLLARGAAVSIGFGRIVASEIETPDLFVSVV